MFLTDRTVLEREFRNRSDVHLIPETFYPSGLGIALPEGSPFLDEFNRVYAFLMHFKF